MPLAPGSQSPLATTLPGGVCVQAYHVGDYYSIGHTYRRVLDFCHRQGYQIVSDSYEFCINDYISSKNEEEFVTKIVFMVQKK